VVGGERMEIKLKKYDGPRLVASLKLGEVDPKDVLILGGRFIITVLKEGRGVLLEVPQFGVRVKVGPDRVVRLEAGDYVVPWYSDAQVGYEPRGR
jgi:hypothetical protein